MNFIKTCGMFGVPLLILTLVNIILVIRAAIRIRSGNGAAPHLERSLTAILFWGFTAAVMGFLGQCSGIYNALTAISRATEIDPQIVMQGFAESFTTTLWGGGLLMLSGLAWFILRTWGQVAGTGAPREA